MLSYIARRLATIPVPLILVIAFVFVVLRLTGDPVAIYLGLDATPEQEAVLRAELAPRQAAGRCSSATSCSTWCRATSAPRSSSSRPAMEVVLASGWARRCSCWRSACWWRSCCGVLGGVACAVWKDRVPDFVISVLAVAGQSMPSFWLGILLIQFFALDLQWLPTSGAGRRRAPDPADGDAGHLPGAQLHPGDARQRARDDARAVRRHGARRAAPARRRALWRHVLPNAINPVVSLVGLQLGRLMGGAVVTESVFAWPGVGAADGERHLPARRADRHRRGVHRRGHHRAGQPGGRPGAGCHRPAHPAAADGDEVVRSPS